MKFDWNEFMNEDNKIAVHCKNEKEATDFVKKYGKLLNYGEGNTYVGKTSFYYTFKKKGTVCRMRILKKSGLSSHKRNSPK